MSEAPGNDNTPTPLRDWLREVIPGGRFVSRGPVVMGHDRATGDPLTWAEIMEIAELFGDDGEAFERRVKLMSPEEMTGQMHQAIADAEGRH